MSNQAIHDYLIRVPAAFFSMRETSKFTPHEGAGEIRITKNFARHLGQMVNTPRGEALITCEEQIEEVQNALRSHVGLKWGSVDPEDSVRNNQSLNCEGMLMSVWDYGHRQETPIRFWIITDPSWAVTTILLPEDY